MPNSAKRQRHLAARFLVFNRPCQRSLMALSWNAYFWIGSGDVLKGQIHVAFMAKDRTGVDAFYRAAIAAGGTDNGPPGLRAHYHPHYYAAFVLDPDGHNIEAMSPAAVIYSSGLLTADLNWSAASMSAAQPQCKRKLRA